MNSRERRSFGQQEALYAVLVLILLVLTAAAWLVITEVLFPSTQIVK